MDFIEEYTSINNENDVEFRYYYRLIEVNYKGLAAYGIEIERDDFIDFKNINLEKEKIEMVSPNINKVKQILFDLYRNQVSPIHLIDIIGTYVDEHVNEFDFEIKDLIVN